MNGGAASHAVPAVRQTHWIFRHRRAAGARGWVQQWPVDSEPSADTGRAGPYQRRRRVAYGGLFNDQRLHEPVAHQVPATVRHPRSEEHTSELQSLMRKSYAVLCLKKKKIKKNK